MQTLTEAVVGVEGDMHCLCSLIFTLCAARKHAIGRHVIVISCALRWVTFVCLSW